MTPEFKLLLLPPPQQKRGAGDEGGIVLYYSTEENCPFFQSAELGQREIDSSRVRPACVCVQCVFGQSGGLRSFGCVSICFHRMRDVAEKASSHAHKIGKRRTSRAKLISGGENELIRDAVEWY